MAEWRHGLCGCFDNCGICIIAYIVPCVSFGQIAEGLGKSCFLYGCLFFIPLVDIYLWQKLRKEIREARGIDGSCFGDLCLHCFCGFCALVQERQEVEEMKKEGVAPGGAAMVRE